ncbi:hypothetical protein STEG23_029014, partial [Scotinomys teguina]
YLGEYYRNLGPFCGYTKNILTFTKSPLSFTGPSNLALSTSNSSEQQLSFSYYFLLSEDADSLIGILRTLRITEVEMGRHQYKITYNNIKNKTSPEPSPTSTPRPEHFNVDKAEENDLKKKNKNLMKMLEEAFEEKMKNVNKETEEKKSKKLEEMNNEMEEKNKKSEEMNNEIEEKKNKRVEEMNKEIEEKQKIGGTQ